MRKELERKPPEEMRRYRNMLKILTNYSMDKISKNKLAENFNTYLSGDGVPMVVTLKEELFYRDKETVMSTVIVNLYTRQRLTRFVVQDKSDSNNFEELYYDFSLEGNFLPSENGPVAQRLTSENKLDALKGLEALAREKEPQVSEYRLVNSETGKPYYEDSQ